MKKTGDLTQDEYDNALDDMDDIRSKIQNLDFKSIANDKLVLATLAEKTEEMLNMKSNIDTMISEINEGKKGIDGQLTEKIKEYEDKLQDAKSTLSSVKNDGFSNIEDYRNKTSLDINSFVNKIEDIKSKISSNTSVSFIDKKNFLNDIKKYVKSIDSKVDEFITDIQDIKTKASEHEKNKKVIEEIKGEDL
jgi:Na+/phosphate symporter